jgi:hypothetical protein
MRFPSSLRTLTGVVPLIVLALAGCGGGGDDAAVATAVTARSAPPSASAAADPIAQYVEAQRAWVHCLRDAGLEAPDPDAKGRVALDSAGKVDPTFRAAQQKCASLSVAVPAGVEEKPTYSAEEIRYRRDYAACMRDNGEPDFPDPDASGSWPEDGTNGGSMADPRKAEAICAPVLAGGAPDPSATPAPGQG